MVRCAKAAKQGVITYVLEGFHLISAEIHKVYAPVRALNLVRFPGIESAGRAKTHGRIIVKIQVRVRPICAVKLGAFVAFLRIEVPYEKRREMLRVVFLFDV